MKVKKKERKDESLFHLAILIGLLFSLATSLSIILISYCINNVSTIYFLISICPFLICVFLGFNLFDRAKRKFRNLLYTYENIYLFKKYLFLLDALITVGIAFLLGTTPSVVSYFHIENELLVFSLNILLTVFDCVFVALKCIFQYSYTIWVANRQKEGETPIG